MTKQEMKKWLEENKKAIRSRTKRRQAAIRKAANSIEIDGINYLIPQFLQSATDEDIRRSLWGRARSAA